MRWKKWLSISAAVLLFLFGITRIPYVHSQLEWRLDRTAGIVRGWLYPGETIPVPDFVASGTDEPGPAQQPLGATTAPTSLEPDPAAQSTPTPTLIPLPASVFLPEPEWEKQDWNNCGPAVLSMALRYYGWPGDQFAISDYNKPDRADKNVNITELIYYVKNFAGWLDADYRVGGNPDTLHRFLAAGYPVIIEVSNDIFEGGGGWAAHYLLVTGFNDEEKEYRVLNSYLRDEDVLSYAELDEKWKPFNHVYMVVYPPEDRDRIEELFGVDLDPEANREGALARADSQAAVDPADAYAWFNMGTNLAALERYQEASVAYDEALTLGLPWRFMRYQFGPYLAYFNSGRFDDVIELAELTLQRTPNSEEALLWRGWANYQLANPGQAASDFREAYRLNPSYQDAGYALDFLGISP